MTERFWIEFWIELFILAALVALSAFFSAAETAVTSLGKLKLKEIIEREKTDRKKYYTEWFEHPERYLVTLLIGNNVVNISASSLATILTIDLLNHFGWAQSAGRIVGLSTGVMTFVLLVFAEITPKTFAKQHYEGIAQMVIGVIYRMSRILRIIVRGFTFVSNLLIRAIGGKRIQETPFITEAELKNLMKVSSREGLIEKHELEMLHSIFAFDDTLVRQIMIPRVDVVSVEVTSSLPQVLAAISESGFTRLPVYEESLDNVLGILYAKDLLDLWRSGAVSVDLRKHLRKPLFVPAAKKVNLLLQDFKRQRTHMAIVVDEYGGVSGIITIEDIIEEIVGEIRDETDEGEMDKIAHLSDGSYVIDAALPLQEFNEKFSVTLKSRMANSLGGYLVERAGAIPPKGSVITLNDLKFTVVVSDEKKISKIKMEFTRPGA
ncbi:HlyC/CorC family transporter [bacterium]|nr:HlyC/CorC family transporter [bacterium]